MTTQTEKPLTNEEIVKILHENNIGSFYRWTGGRYQVCIGSIHTGLKAVPARLTRTELLKWIEGK